MTGGPPPPPLAGRPHRRPSIKDVAELAGVSWKTVSNVIHHPDRVRPENRERVEQAIAQLDYRVSVAGRQLRQGRSRVITLAIPDIASAYFAQLSREIIRRAADAEHSVLIDDTDGDVDRERNAATGYSVQFADGVILSASSLDTAALARLRPHNPVVVLGELDLTQPATDLLFDRVAIDNIAAAREVTDHLLDTGRRRLVFLGSPATDRGTGHLRQQGFLAALAERGIQPVTLWQLPSWGRGEGHTATAALLQSGMEVDAVVCGNDLLAIGALRAIREAGRTVGEDIALTGWDDTEEGRFAHPCLTTVAHDLEALARAAVGLLLRRIEGSTEPATLQTVPHQLVVRASSGAN